MRAGLAGVLFAIALLDASIIGAFAVSLSTAYAIGDVFGLKHSLHRGVKGAKGFYAVYGGLVLLAAAVVLIPGSPLGLLTEGVQALAGVLLPSAAILPAAAVQRPRGPRPLGERPQDEPVHRRRGFPARRPVGDPDRARCCSPASPPGRSWSSSRPAGGRPWRSARAGCWSSGCGRPPRPRSRSTAPAGRTGGCRSWPCCGGRRGAGRAQDRHDDAADLPGRGDGPRSW